MVNLSPQIYDVSLELGSMLAANAIKQIGASPIFNDVANEIFKKYPQFARLLFNNLLLISVI